MNIDFSKVDIEAIGKKVLAESKRNGNRELRKKILSVLPIWGDGKPSMGYAQVQKELQLFCLGTSRDIAKQLNYLKSKGLIRGKAGYCKRVMPKS